MQLLDGKKAAVKVKKEIAEEVAQRNIAGKEKPHLAAVLVGNDGASMTYVANKVRSCKEVGIESTLLQFPETITQDALLTEVEKLNKDKSIHGYIVQLPLPKQIDEQSIIMAIDPEKDVDGFHPVNVGKMTLELPSFLPATPSGILELLKTYDINTSGSHVVVVGRSHIVGRPMSILLSQKRTVGDATVTMTHSKTKNLKEITLQADIIVVAIGIPDFLKEDMVKENAVVIDVGISRVADSSRKNGYRLVGDVDFEKVKNKASFITPVPGGVGPMTIAMLLRNTLLACKNQLS